MCRRENRLSSRESRKQELFSSSQGKEKRAQSFLSLRLFSSSVFVLLSKVVLSLVESIKVVYTLVLLSGLPHEWKGIIATASL